MGYSAKKGGLLKEDLNLSLPEFLALSSASGTRQSPYCTRQRPFSKNGVGETVIAEYHLSGTRQRLCRVPTLGKDRKLKKIQKVGKKGKKS